MKDVVVVVLLIVPLFVYRDYFFENYVDANMSPE